MNTAVHPNTAHPCPAPAPAGRSRGLRNAALAWFAVATLGQLMFVVYILGFHGAAVLAGELERWNRVAPHLYRAGDTLGNATLAAHALLAAVVVGGGALQLTPWLRRVAPAVHRWNGRLYLSVALLMCLSGFYMVWVRGTIGSTTQHLGITLNGVVTLICGFMAWRHAVARRLVQHREWALRLYLAVLGVWFFRIGLLAWVIAHRAPVGFDPKTFTGPFLVFLSYAQFLVPLAVLELYLRAQRSARPGVQTGVAITLAALTVLTLLGSAGASMAMWLPHLR